MSGELQDTMQRRFSHLYALRKVCLHHGITVENRVQIVQGMVYSIAKCVLGLGLNNGLYLCK